MDIKAKAAELVEKIKNDPSLLKKFRENPVPVVESLIGMDLPDAQVEKIIEAVKAKINIDKVGDLLGGIGGLFGKK